MVVSRVAGPMHSAKSSELYAFLATYLLSPFQELFSIQQLLMDDDGLAQGERARPAGGHGDGGVGVGINLCKICPGQAITEVLGFGPWRGPQRPGFTIKVGRLLATPGGVTIVHFGLSEKKNTFACRTLMK